MAACARTVNADGGVTMAGLTRRDLLVLPFTIWMSQRLMALQQADAEDADKLTPLMRAAAKGDLKTVNALLDKGANPNLQNSVQRLTPMMFASFHGHIDVVNALFAKSADPRIQDALGARAVDWAILGRHPEIVKLHTSRGVLEHPFLDLGSMPYAIMDRAAGKK